MSDGVRGGLRAHCPTPLPRESGLTMLSYRFEDFAQRAVLLDDSRFSKCKFHHCTLIYSGTTRVVLDGQLGGDVDLRLQNGALNTLTFLGSLYQDREFRPLLVKLLEQVGIPVRADPPTHREAATSELWR